MKRFDFQVKPFLPVPILTKIVMIVHINYVRLILSLLNPTIDVVHGKISVVFEADSDYRKLLKKRFLIPIVPLGQNRFYVQQTADKFYAIFVLEDTPVFSSSNLLEPGFNFGLFNQRLVFLKTSGK